MPQTRQAKRFRGAKCHKQDKQNDFAERNATNDPFVALDLKPNVFQDQRGCRDVFRVVKLVHENKDCKTKQDPREQCLQPIRVNFLRDPGSNQNSGNHDHGKTYQKTVLNRDILQTNHVTTKEPDE